MDQRSSVGPNQAMHIGSYHWIRWSMMALPSNDYHVHSDGYRSDRGSVDTDRMLAELADEIVQIDGVRDVWPDEACIEVTYDGEHETYEQCERIADDWDCVVPSVSDEWLEVRPAE